VPLGKQVVEFLTKKELLQYVEGIKALMLQYPDKILTPVDVALDFGGVRKEVDLATLPTDYLIFDIGHETAKKYAKIISEAKAIVVSGPMGVYENPEFNYGTKSVLTAIAKSEAYSLAGGGNTISAIQEYKLTKKIGYISTAGGALIEFLMGKKLPGVVALENAVKVKKI
jgi:phosphoglycerate kinase